MFVCQRISIRSSSKGTEGIALCKQGQNVFALGDQELILQSK